MTASERLYLAGLVALIFAIVGLWIARVVPPPNHLLIASAILALLYWAWRTR